jgi:hypothetical protein
MRGPDTINVEKVFEQAERHRQAMRAGVSIVAHKHQQYIARMVALGHDPDVLFEHPNRMT